MMMPGAALVTATIKKNLKTTDEIMFYWTLTQGTPKLFCPPCRLALAAGPKRSVGNLNGHFMSPRHYTHYTNWKQVGLLAFLLGQ
jgi:hypothetical protein